MTKGLNVAIVGGGITGLAFAIALSKDAPDLNVDIYEATSSFSTIGAGIGMWPRVWEIMEIYGLAEALDQQQGANPGDGRFRYRRSDLPSGIQIGEAKVGVRTYHRADFLQVLLEHVPQHYGTHFSKRLASYDDDPEQGTVTLRFTDGSSATCDVLVASDGIKSAVRQTMYTRLAEKARCEGATPEEVEILLNHVPATWSGELVYRHLITREDIEKAFPNHPSLNGPTLYMSEHRYIITYPISQGRAFNTGAFIAYPGRYGSIYEGPWTREATQDELRTAFTGCEPAAQVILDLMVRPSVWAINIVPPIPTYTFGRVVLLGDAAHAMRPHQGAGAGQGVEDGFVLAAVLGSPLTTRQTLSVALEAYDKIRRPVVEETIRRSIEMGQSYFLERPWSSCHEDLATASEAQALKFREPSIIHAFEDSVRDLYAWAWFGSAQPQRRQVRDVLGAMIM
ncbi:salicylate hydroxylase [Obba rivulosa]|uniref:Salicylate hydroxylase n=1 Tax=Obba rivulosa TaxID=1052685 RepID=A0A8E2AW17_9APHY|nr:salicylate hydroxylase [Obba rivulosa]